MRWVFRFLTTIGFIGINQARAEIVSKELTSNIYVPLICAENSPDRRAYLTSYMKRVRSLQEVWIEEFGEDCLLEEEFQIGRASCRERV